MTVATLRTEMSALEFMQWSRYFAVKAQRRQLENLRAG